MVDIKFCIKAGSAYESYAQKGAAHLLSVSALSGTKTMTGLGIYRKLENLGATVTSSADREKVINDICFDKYTYIFTSSYIL